MGYTHYWYKVRELNQDSFNNFIADFEAIVPQFSDLLDTYEDKMEISPSLLRFNGIGEEAHETFYFDRVVAKEEFEQYANDTKTHIFNFTKTARKPYDIAVTSALIIAKKHFGKDIIVSSDGSNEEWQEAKDLCQSILNYGSDFDMEYESKTCGEFKGAEILN